MLTRRRVLVSAGGFLLAGGCTRNPSTPSFCDDTSALTPDEKATRTTLAYADRSPDQNKTCKACQQWVAPTRDGSCGSCKLLKGPIHPDGTCKTFAPKG